MSDLEGMELLGDELAKNIMYNVAPYSDDCTHMIGDTKVTYDHLSECWLVARPYVSHPIAVAALMNTEHRKVIALLHDVDEDTDFKLVWNELFTDKTFFGRAEPELEMYPITEREYNDLKLMTKQPGDTYTTYMKRIADSGNDDVIAVKLADNFHNLSCDPTTKQKDKYLAHAPMLLATI